MGGSVGQVVLPGTQESELPGPLKMDGGSRRCLVPAVFKINHIGLGVEEGAH
jgi:hypothetical protein